MITMMVQPPQARDTVAHVNGDSGPSTLLIFLIVVGILVAGYFLWKAYQNKKDDPTIPPTIPPTGTTHTTNPPKR
jgi:uncharacterized membrane protein YidH (DUF202 family)